MKPMRAGHVIEVLATQEPFKTYPELLPKAGTLKQWARRGLLHPTGKNHLGQHLYDPGEVLDVALRHADILA